MTLVWSLIAFLLPSLCGMLIWSLLRGRPHSMAAWCACIGAGYLLGAIGLGAILARCDGLEVASARSMVVGALILFAAVGATLLWRYPSPVAARSVPAMRNTTRLEAVGAALSIAILAVLFALLLFQAFVLPTLGWDAWNAWLAKPKAWFHLGLLTPAVSFESWLESARGEAITAVGWPYPEALPRHAFWLAAVIGAWNESIVHLAWPFAWAALGLILWGSLVEEGVRRSHAVAVTTAVLSLPMFLAHAVLAGYADLWLAAMLCLAGIQLHRWSLRRSWPDAVAFLVSLLLLPAIKSEGAVWMACLLLAAILVRVPIRISAAILIGGLLLWVVLLPWGGLTLPFPGMGWVRLGWGELETTRFGIVALHWQSVQWPVLQSLFLLPNWSLLWYLAPCIAFARWRVVVCDPAMRALAWFLLFGFGFLFLLFFFTDAATWAQDFTSINRVLMHVVPTLVFWLSLMWLHPSHRDKFRPSVG